MKLHSEYQRMQLAPNTLDLLSDCKIDMLWNACQQKTIHWLRYKFACVHMRAPVSQRRISSVLLCYSWSYFFDAGSLTELGTLFVCLFVLLLFFSSDWPGSVCLHPSAPPLEIKGIQSHCWISCGYKRRPACLSMKFFNHLSQLSARI